MTFHRMFAYALALLWQTGCQRCESDHTAGRSGRPVALPEVQSQAPEKPVVLTTVYAPRADSAYKYNHAPMITSFQGKLFVMWSAAPRDEDVNVDTLLATSADGGATWSTESSGYTPLMQNEMGGTRYNPSSVPRAGFDPDDPTTPLELQGAGFWGNAGRLVAYFAVFDTWYGARTKLTRYRTTTDGVHWSEPQFLRDGHGQLLRASLQESPKRFGNRLFGVFNIDNESETGLVQSPFYTDDLSGQGGWTKAAFTPADFLTPNGQGKELEGSLFASGDKLSVVYRNMEDETLLLSQSEDWLGTSWSPATDLIPAGPNKSSAGNWHGGMGFFLANPVSKRRRRAPLNLFLTADGKTILRSYTLLTMDSNEGPRFRGLYKSSGFSYPNSFVDDDGVLWIAYARNKEDIQVLKVEAKVVGL